MGTANVPDEPQDQPEVVDAHHRSCASGPFAAAPSRLRQLLELSVELAREAGGLQKTRTQGQIRVETKSSATDLVSEVDRESERAIVERLSAVRPDDAILAEEGTLRAGTSGVRWVIDPLDGTTNYLYGYPAFAVSIAVELDGQARIGTVYDSSAGCCYTALRGFGAFCEDRPLKVREQSDLARSVVATGFSYDARQRELQGEVLGAVLCRVSDIRRSGSAALDLCHVAAGHLDAYWELDNGPWDYGAGSVIAREAGAQVLFAPAAHGRGPAVVAANSSLMPSLLVLLQEAGALAGPAFPA
jgi:myo-inositol-1(or 4)-monophosphatase